LVILILLALFGGLAVNQVAEARFRAVAGGWDIELEYCEYGIRLTLMARLGDVDYTPGAGFDAYFETRLFDPGTLVASGPILAQGNAGTVSFEPFDPTGTMRFAESFYFSWFGGVGPAAGTDIASRVGLSPLTGPYPDDTTLINFPDLVDDDVVKGADCSFTYENVFPPALFTDNRLNPDPAATAVAYCVRGNVQVYAIDTQSRGTLVINVPQAEINALEVEGSAVVVASATGVYGEITLYKLSNGRLQVVAPALPPESFKGYTFSWPGC
jgi:hypothetical protein